LGDTGEPGETVSEEKACSSLYSVAKSKRPQTEESDIVVAAGAEIDTRRPDENHT
jgi:hypothetical protein